MEEHKVINNEITEGVIWKQLLSFFYPILLGTFFQQLYNSIDAIVIGRFVGKEALAAISGSASTLVNLLLGFFIGLSCGATVLISQAYGAKDTRGIRNGIHTAMAVSLIIGALFTVLGILFAPYLLQLTNAPKDTIQDSILYMDIIFGGILASILYNTCSGIMRALGDSKRPFYYLMTGCVLNIILDLILVAVIPFGVFGAGIATILSQLVTAVLLMRKLMQQDEKYCLQLRHIRLERQTLHKMMIIGLPAGLQSVMYSISNLIIQASINSFGTDTVAAWGVYGKVDGIFWMVMSALGVSITTFVGQNYGARKISRVKKSTRICMGIAIVITFSMSTVLYLFAGIIFGIFTKDPNVIQIGIQMMHFLTPTYITYISIEILSGSIRGTGNTFLPTVITFVGICFLRVLWIFLITTTHLTLEGVMFSYPLTWVVTSVAFIVYYRYFIRKMEGANSLL
ncbi:MAG: hypothetical protein PWP24_996 [Clostridiales bacterium]|nr:hypothetical protein [Clostridiales bacterium]